MSIARPFNFSKSKYAINDIGSYEHRANIVHCIYTEAEATAEDVEGIHDAIDCTNAKKSVNTGFKAMSCARNITATVSGKADDIKAVKVKVTGLNAKHQEISEELPAFKGTGTVKGKKAFIAVTKVEIPAMSGKCTVSIGTGSALGLPYILAGNTVLCTLFGGKKESTAPAVTTGTAIEDNTITITSALAGKQIDAYLLV